MVAELDTATQERLAARSLPFEDAFDLVVCDSTLVHVPGPDRAIAQAYRVLHL